MRHHSLSVFTQFCRVFVDWATQQRNTLPRSTVPQNYFYPPVVISHISKWEWTESKQGSTLTTRGREYDNTNCQGTGSVHTKYLEHANNCRSVNTDPLHSSRFWWIYKLKLREKSVPYWKAYKHRARLVGEEQNLILAITLAEPFQLVIKGLGAICKVRPAQTKNHNFRPAHVASCFELVIHLNYVVKLFGLLTCYTKMLSYSIRGFYMAPTVDLNL